MNSRMKIISLFLALMMLFTSASCAEEIAGGWHMAEDSTITPEAQAALDAALEGFTGSGIEAVALLGTQVVAGVNYCLLCKVTPVVPDAVGRYALVYVYQHLDGSAEITDIEDIEIGAHRQNEADEDGIIPEAFSAQLPVATFVVSCFVEGMEAENGLTLRQQTNGDTEASVFLSKEDGTYEWLMHIPAEDVAETDEEYTLVYSDCIHTFAPYSAQGPEDEIVRYTNGSGTIKSTAEGHYIWIDDQDNAGEGLDFTAGDTLYVITEYMDVVSERAMMTLYSTLSPQDADTQTMTAVVSWGDSAAVTYEWMMNIEAPVIMDPSEEIVLSYSDGICVRITTTEDGEDREIVYENGTGHFTLHMDEDGQIGYTWYSDKDNFDSNCIFYPLYIG